MVRKRRKMMYQQDMKLNLKPQCYKGISLQVIQRSYKYKKAKRFALGGTNQNVWIPNKHLLDDGTIKAGEDIDYVLRRAPKQLELAGCKEAIPGIKRRTSEQHA